MVQVARQHPPLPESDVLEAKAQHLAAAQPAQHHGVDHARSRWVPSASTRAFTSAGLRTRGKVVWRH